MSSCLHVFQTLLFACAQPVCWSAAPTHSCQVLGRTCKVCACRLDYHFMAVLLGDSRRFEEPQCLHFQWQAVREHWVLYVHFNTCCCMFKVHVCARHVNCLISPPPHVHICGWSKCHCSIFKSRFGILFVNLHTSDCSMCVFRYQTGRPNILSRMVAGIPRISSAVKFISWS